MKTKSLFTQYMEEFKQSDTLYCYYCLECKGENVGCCGENHFGEFRYLDREDQIAIIENELQLAFDLEEKQ